MRHFGIAFSLAVALTGVGVTPSHADKAPWCAFLGGNRGGSTECLYYSIAQCQATVSGFGGYCFRNPDYAPQRKKRRGYE